MPSGGARKGAGKKKGHKLLPARKTFLQQRRDAEKAYQMKVLKNADRLLQHQIMNAVGVQYLFRIDTTEDGKRNKPVLVISKKEIKEFLKDPDNNIQSGAYYYITTDKPDNRAIDSMLDRTFGKATQKNVMVDEDDKVVPISGITMIVPNKKSDEKTN